MYESIPCKECVPPEVLERHPNVRGYWDIYKKEDFAYCSNCGFERPFTRRKAKITGVPNPSQQKAIDRIEHYFKDWRNEYDENWNPVGGAYNHETLHLFEVKPTDYGTFWVYVEDVEHILIQSGGSFHIGKRGAIELYSICNLCGNDTEHRKTMMKHYARGVGGKVAK